MKKLIILFVIPLLLCLLPTRSARAGLVVTDPTLIAINKAHHARDLAEQLLRKANQVQQIEQLIRQVTQLDDYLKRYGHPGISVADPELKKLIDLLKSEALSRSSEELFEGVDGVEVFASDEKLPGAIRPNVIVDGTEITPRNPQVYREDAETKRTMDHYTTVRQQVLERRQSLRLSIASTIQQLQAAHTESEIRKLAAVLTALQTELAAIDQEVGFAASAVMTHELQIEANRRLRAKAQQEEDRVAHRTASRKDAAFYQLLTKPTFFNAHK